MNKKALILAASLLAPVFAHAACTDFMQTWVDKLHPGRTLDTTLAVCKQWPANPDLTLAVLPLEQKGNSDDQGTDDLAILVADSTSGSVIARLYEPDAITFDAVRVSAIELDTARYQLKPGNRAFGVRVHYSGSSSANSFGGTSLSLYTIEGQTLHKVVDRLAVSSGSGETNGECDGFYDSTDRTIDIGPISREGYAVLKMSEKSTHTVSKMVSGKCVDKDTSQRKSFDLNYTNGRYAVSKALQWN
ncbi:hypothetical protein AWB77_01384 [Caballeronia fortuita]|uniref:Multidrug ABC transporter ATPase n=1 Tax=Caballeronia fortuita TaxID=1777138 RepID=A0A158A3A0_9BURK|nr:hypothetical protein [Caballeronia fortuita]SAK52240.1 hypothetical protein AWB77_01384 [Caballeronia fortuita]